MGKVEDWGRLWRRREGATPRLGSSRIAWCSLE